jgi:hypothetical protein
LFQTYAAAHDAVTNHGNTDPEMVAMNVAWIRANDNAFNTGFAGGGAEWAGLANKFLSKANALDLNGFKNLRFNDNRIDRTW